MYLGGWFRFRFFICPLAPFTILIHLSFRGTGSFSLYGEVFGFSYGQKVPLTGGKIMSRCHYFFRAAEL